MKHVLQALKGNNVKVIDRRGKALGGNPRQRRLSAITKGAVHWTASNRQGELSAIEGHEAWWRSIPQTMGNMGGYHIFIPRSGTAIINYDFETQTSGVGRQNSYTVHVSYEGNPANPMTESQRRTLKVVWNAIPKDVPGIKSMDDVLGHNEFPGHASNQCPGINMNNFRSYLKDNRKVEVVVSNNLYRVQVGAFSDRKNAEQLAKELQDKGYPVYIPENGGTQDSPKPAAQPTPAPTPQKTIDQLAQEVLAGKHGTGDARRQSLGSQFSEVQARVNELLGANQPTPKKSVDEVAREIINGQGGWGNNPQRAERLRAAGYDPAEVQRRVNQLV